MDITIATGDLTKYEAAYDKLVADLEAAGKAANDGLTSLIELMKQGEKSLKDLQAKFPADITDQQRRARSTRKQTRQKTNSSRRSKKRTKRISMR